MRGAIVLILASIFASSAGQRAATAECYDRGSSYQMVFTVTANGDADLIYVYSINLTSPFFDPALIEQCGSNTTSFYEQPSAGVFRINITVDKPGLGVDKECGESRDGLAFEWMFRTTKHQFIITRSVDVQYRVVCNFSEATQTELTSGPFNITGDVTELTPIAASNTFVLDLVDAASYAPLGPLVALGTAVRLRITRILGDATGVSGFSCRAGNNALFDKELTLLDFRGCSSAPAILGSGFAPLVIPAQVEAVTGSFEQFMFTGFNQVYYQCTIHYCTGGQDVPCDDLCANGGPSGRKKRQAGDEPEEEQDISTTVTITMFPTRQISDPPETTEKTPQVPSCLSNTGIIAAFAVLGALLLVTVAVAVFVCVRSMRLTSNLHRREKPKL